MSRILQEIAHNAHNGLGCLMMTRCVTASPSMPSARVATVIDADADREPVDALVPLSALMSGASGRSNQSNGSLSP
jgi:hypothetical protein